jgi:hypothetical protein
VFCACFRCSCSRVVLAQRSVGLARTLGQQASPQPCCRDRPRHEQQHPSPVPSRLSAQCRQRLPPCSAPPRSSRRVSVRAWEPRRQRPSRQPEALRRRLVTTSGLGESCCGSGGPLDAKRARKFHKDAIVIDLVLYLSAQSEYEPGGVTSATRRSRLAGCSFTAQARLSHFCRSAFSARSFSETACDAVWCRIHDL